MSEYERLSFVLINGIKPGSEFGIDGRVWTVKRCDGVKLVPPGFHVFTCGPAIDESGFGVRHALLRMFGQSETVTCDSTEDGSFGRVEQDAVVSLQYKQSIDASLAPCQGHPRWPELVRLITPATLTRSFASTTAVIDAFTEFDSIDLRKSAPAGSTGTDLSKWTRDKSHLLRKTINTIASKATATATATAAANEELVAEVQLSFVLFTLVHNYAALEKYQALFRLVCMSSDAMLNGPESLLPLVFVFITTANAQLVFVDPDIFDQLPALEQSYLDSLAALRQGLEDALPTYAPDHPVWQATIKAWTKLADTVVERFGWQIGMIRGSRRTFASTTDDGIAIEDLEEGEDAPVIVE